MKTRKNRRGVSTIIAVLLMIIITVAAAVIVWAFLSGYIGSRTAPTTQQSVIQINAIDRSAAGASVQLVTRGSNATIVGVYVNGAPAAGFTPNAAKFSSTATTGTIVTISFTGPLNVGDVVKVVCADGGAASLAAT